MAKKTLVISGDDPHRFFLSLDGGTLTVGDRTTHPETTFWGLHVARVRVELEVEDDVVQLNDLAKRESGDPSAAQDLQPGLAVHAGHAHYCLLVQTPPAVAHAKPATAAAPDGKPDQIAYRFRVVDGADQGRIFSLPFAGTVGIGKSNRHAHIVLHDLYVSRLHCEVTVEDGVVTVAHIEGETGTRIDGTPIVETAILRPGCVLRVGNSHLRLETGPLNETPDEVESVPLASPVSGRMAKAPLSGIAGPTSGRLKKPGSVLKSSDPLAALEGQIFGKYRLGPPLGRGLTGTVFQAVDLTSEQTIAVKVLLDSFPAAQSELDRFARVMKEAAAVQHPNILALYGGGRTMGHCWIARECVEGESVSVVAQRIADGERPSWVRACRVAIHLARALEAIHQQQKIHGHLAGRHVLLGNADNATKLADFLFAEATADSRLRQSIPERKLLPELGYLAPEQTEEGAFVDRLADLYSLGAVAYALLTGRPPFTGETVQDVVNDIRAGRPTKPTEFHRKIPATFEALVVKLLARQQEDRYQSATELLADLEAIAADHDMKV